MNPEMSGGATATLFAEPWPGPAKAAGVMAEVQAAVETRRLRPHHPTLVRLGKEVVAALQDRDLERLRAACRKMTRAVERLPAGQFNWTITPPPRKPDPDRAT